MARWRPLPDRQTALEPNTGDCNIFAILVLLACCMIYQRTPVHSGRLSNMAVLCSPRFGCTSKVSTSRALS